MNFHSQLNVHHEQAIRALEETLQRSIRAGITLARHGLSYACRKVCESAIQSPDFLFKANTLDELVRQVEGRVLSTVEFSADNPDFKLSIIDLDDFEYNANDEPTSTMRFRCMGLLKDGEVVYERFKVTTKARGDGSYISTFKFGKRTTDIVHFPTGLMEATGEGKNHWNAIITEMAYAAITHVLADKITTELFKLGGVDV